jgi:hypothetical protein
MPEEVLSLREAMLAPEQYRDLAARWRAYVTAHPGSAVAHVMLSRAMRYAEEGTPDERATLVRTAIGLDPDSPEALDAMAGLALGKGDVSIARAREYAERAVRLAPEWPAPHFTLWSLDAAERKTESAATHARALIEKGAIPSPLLDFGYNMLESAEPDAIVFTNGDNDTYPPLALQAKHGIRTDVRIVNLSLLNVVEYAAGALGAGPLAEADIRRRYADWKGPGPTGAPMFSLLLIECVAELVGGGKWKEPVYLALTVAPATLEHVDRERQVEGLLWRVLPGKAGRGDDEEPRVAYARTLQLFRDGFRLDSATDLAFPWEARSSVRMLMKNYPAVLRIVGTEAAKRGDTGAVRFAMGEAVRILSFHGERETAAEVARYWDEIDPDRPRGESPR